MEHHITMNDHPKIFHILGQAELKRIAPTILLSSNQDDLFRKTRSFFIIGRILGVVPFSGVFQKSYLNLTFSPFSLPSWISIFIITTLVINFTLESIQATRVSKQNAVELAVAVKAPIYYGYGLFVYLYFYIRAKKIINLFHCWMKARTVFSIPDKNLSKDVILVTLGILTSGFLENGILHLKYLEKFDTLNDIVTQGYKDQQIKFSPDANHSSILEVFYRRSHYDWHNAIGYNAFYAVLIFVSNKLTLYCWNYIDLFIAICGRAINYRFKCLYEISVKKFVPKRRNGQIYFQQGYFPDHGQWLQMVTDHETLYNLVKEFEEILSPLIFLSYATNVFYICMQVYMGLNSEDSGPESVIHSIYAPWSLLHLGFRTYFVSISLARVNVYAHKIMDVLIECPMKFYDKKISRLDRRVTMGRKIGFTGLGCFTVTKPFILQVIGVIFTFEIVLLQGSSATSEVQCSKS